MEEIIMHAAEKLFLLFVLLKATYLNGCVMKLLEEILTKSTAIPANSLASSSFDVNGTIGSGLILHFGLMWVES